jgi:hypothetical protein
MRVELTNCHRVSGDGGERLNIIGHTHPHHQEVASEFFPWPPPSTPSYEVQRCTGLPARGAEKRGRGREKLEQQAKKERPNLERGKVRHQ